MNVRRILYITVLCAIAALLYYDQQTSVPEPQPELLGKEAVFKIFKDGTGPIPNDLVKAGYVPAEIYFPADYEGTAGDEFYISLHQGEQLITLKYLVRTADSPAQLELYCKDRWENYKPPAGKFEQYRLSNGTWTKG